MHVAVENLPDLSAPYALSESQCQAYRQSGHILLRGVCAPEDLPPYREAIGADVRRHAETQARLEERDTYGKAFLQVGNLWTRDEVVKRYVTARRFAQIAADLMGVSGVRIYHDQALFKEAGGGFTPWHQDQHYWPLATDHTITMWMPLVDADVDMGVMRFASGSHTEGYLGDMEISDASEAHFKQYVKERGYALSTPESMRAGDATFHSGWTLHCAPGNETDRMREVMTVIYFADGVRTAEPDNENRKRDLANWLPGCAPGDLAASPLNPVVYP